MYPEALPILIGSSLPDDVSFQLKVSVAYYGLTSADSVINSF